MSKHSLVYFSLIALSLISVNPSFSQKPSDKADQADKILHCGALLNIANKKVLKKITVYIKGEKIIALKKGFSTEDNVQIINLKDAFVMPGMMDMHVHLEKEYNKSSYLENFTLGAADLAFQSTKYAKLTLMAGFTTVRDLGGTGVNTSLRNAINKGIVDGPRVYSAGKSIATTGGHADPTNGWADHLRGDPNAVNGVINSRDEARKAVRQRYKNGADVIKITATGGVLSVAKNGQNPQFTMDELKGIVEVAKDYEMVTAAHAHGDEGMKRAVIAGINSIEHGTYMSIETMNLMKKHGTYYVPTITAGKYVAAKAKIKGFYPPLVVPKALAVGPQIQGTFAKAMKEGVTIAFGTDAGVFPHGENGKEFGYMVEAGMTPMDALYSATISAAKLLRILDKVGTLEKGKYADIIAVEGDPLKDISEMEDIDFVMKGGKVYKNKI